MHPIELLNHPTKSLVRTNIHDALRQLTGLKEYESFSIKELFLRSADNLVKTKVIERPEFLGGKSLGGQDFISLLRNRQDNLFPNYGIPHTISSFIRLTLWDLLAQGVLAPTACINPYKDNDYFPPRENNHWLCFELVMLTPYGVKLLQDSENLIQVHDPEGYLDNFLTAHPPPDDEMMRYVQESIAVFSNGHLFACIVLLGTASERLVDVLADKLKIALKDKQGEKWFNEKYKNKRMISDRFLAIKGKLMGEFGKELAQLNLKDAFQGIVTLTFEQLRHARNDIAHPQGREFTRNEVSGFLHNFVQYFKYINQITAFLDSRA